jgi:hypothetical protein
MYHRELEREEHRQRFLIIPSHGDGWEVRQERDNEVLVTRRVYDWHRVESARRWFASEVAQLRAAGWTEIASRS